MRISAPVTARFASGAPVAIFVAGGVIVITFAFPGGGEATLDTWLSREIDPLVMAGKVRWGTYSQIADAYIAAGR